MDIKRIIKEELEDGFKDSTEGDWDWTENKIDLSKTIFYSEKSSGVYDQWTVGYDMYKLLLNNGVRWNSGHKVAMSDDTKFYDRFYVRVDEDNFLTLGSVQQKLTIDFLKQRRFRGYTLINVDDEY